METISPIHGLDFTQIKNKIVLKEKCLGCSACVAACPTGCLEFKQRTPHLIKECANCGICMVVCPQYDYTLPALEESIFGRQSRKDEIFGIYRRIVKARAKDNNTLQVCQDGGVVTALLTFALEKGKIDGAAISGMSDDKTEAQRGGTRRSPL